jgi:hypothetical protein
MRPQTLEAHDHPINPLDIVEELVLANDWPFQRSDDNELVIEIAGRWCEYRLFFVWQEECSALHFCCRIDGKIIASSRVAVSDLLARINERLWVGHFDLSGPDQVIVYRHTSLLRGVAQIGSEIVEDLVQLALAECDRYYPAFQLVMWAGKTPEEAICASILDPVGEA